MRLRIANSLRRLANRLDRQPDAFPSEDYGYPVSALRWEDVIQPGFNAPSVAWGIWLKPIEGD